MAIGEAGSITTNSPTENEPIRIEFEQPLTDPVFALTATNNGGNQFVLRVIDEELDADGNTTAFSFIIEEWEYHDGPHPATETINWIAIEEGVHELPDGRIIEAGTVSTSDAGQNVNFNGGFTDAPVVLTSVMSNNDTTTVDSDPRFIDENGFNIQLQEEEAEADDHGFETVGWIAIQAGGDADSGTANTFGGVDENVDTLTLGDTFGDAIVIAETQTINGGDTATVVIDNQTNSDVSVFIEEEQSNDSETNHIDETVGIVAFEDGLIPCFAAGSLIQTAEGQKAVEALSTEDRVVEHTGQKTPVLAALRRTLKSEDLERHPNLRPIRIASGALGAGLPHRDLLVSPQHRMLVSSKVAERMFGAREVLVAAKRLTDLPGIFVDLDAQEVTYVHLVLDHHAVIFAEGAPTESLYVGSETLKSLAPEARAELEALFPDLARGVKSPVPASYIPPGRRQRQLVARLVRNRKAPLEIMVWR